MRHRATDGGAGARPLPRRAVGRARRRAAALLRRLLRHLRPRQRRRHRPGAARATRPAAATTRRATSRRWCTPRSATRGMRNRLGALVCTSSIGPGATNMVTGAALATVNRLPVLLLPGDVFASRGPDPVLQQLEIAVGAATSRSTTASARCRATSTGSERPEQVIPAALAAMRVLTSPAETGAVTLAFPQDVQAEAFDCPEEFLAERVWHVPRAAAGRGRARRARWPRSARAQRPLIVAGGGVDLLRGDGRAARGSASRRASRSARRRRARARCPYDHPSCLGAIGATGTFAANRVAAEADLVIGIGTRYSDFTTASKTAFRDPGVRFVNVNVAELDAAKHGGVALVGDARAALEQPAGAARGLRGRRRLPRARPAQLDARVGRRGDAPLRARPRPLPAQSEVIGAVNDASAPTDVVVCAAGAMPGDLHKLWRTRDPKGYHVEYGYSCMGYEIAGGLGVKLAAPEREVYVLVGDGSYLMLAGRARDRRAGGREARRSCSSTTAASTRSARSRARSGPDGFGTQYRYRRDGAPVSTATTSRRRQLPLDLAANAASLGARVDPRRDDRRAARRARASAKERRRHDRDRRSRSTATRACRATRAGGTSRSPRSPRRPAVRAVRDGLRDRARVRGAGGSCDEARERARARGASGSGRSAATIWSRRS